MATSSSSALSSSSSSCAAMYWWIEVTAASVSLIVWKTCSTPTSFVRTNSNSALVRASLVTSALNSCGDDAPHSFVNVTGPCSRLLLARPLAASRDAVTS